MSQERGDDKRVQAEVRGACWELLCALIKQIKTEYSKTNRARKTALLGAQFKSKHFLRKGQFGFGHFFLSQFGSRHFLEVNSGPGVHFGFIHFSDFTLVKALTAMV